MSVYDFKPRFQTILRPLSNALARIGVTANAVTIAAIAGSLAVGWADAFAWAWPPVLLILPAWLFIRMALNAIDGMLAREHGMKTRLGGILNEVGDVVSDTTLYLPLSSYTPGVLWPVVFFTIGAALTEFCGVLGQALGASRRYDGPMGKSDRAFLVGALAAATFAFPSLDRAWPVVFWAAAALTAVTCARRCRFALAELSAKGPV
jgi:CDP-diacylglycerol--glycerol-3-phosphate 3-phosphatidyltransferase